MTTILHLFRHENTFSEAFVDELSKLGQCTFHTHCADWGEDAVAAAVRRTEILLTSHHSVRIPPCVAADPGRLAYMCHVHGTIRPFIPREILTTHIPVTNWGDAPGYSVAKAAMTLLLAVISDLPSRIVHVREGGWRGDLPQMALGYLDECRVGIYGCGAIGRTFVEMLRPFACAMSVFDPFAEDIPEGCERRRSLRDLCADADILVVHASLSDDTYHSIDAGMLALLPDHGVVINTARGAIIQQEALFAELQSGRLRAGLDVLEHEADFPVDHPLRRAPNCVLTCHALSDQGDFRRPRLSLAERHALHNIEAFGNGEPLRFTYDCARYDRST